MTSTYTQQLLLDFRLMRFENTITFDNAISLDQTYIWTEDDTRILRTTSIIVIMIRWDLYSLNLAPNNSLHLNILSLSHTHTHSDASATKCVTKDNNTIFIYFHLIL